MNYCRCAEAGVGFLDSKVDKVLEVDEGLSSVLCHSGRTIKSRYCLFAIHSLGLVSSDLSSIKFFPWFQRDAIGEHVLKGDLKHVRQSAFETCSLMISPFRADLLQSHLEQLLANS